MSEHLGILSKLQKERLDPRQEAARDANDALNWVGTIGAELTAAHLSGKSTLKPEYHPEFIEAQLVYEAALERLNAFHESDLTS